jgi:hypothetical protein
MRSEDAWPLEARQNGNGASHPGIANGFGEHAAGGSAPLPDVPAGGGAGFAWAMCLSIVLAICFLGIMVAQDPWKVLAVTRFLDVLIEGGIVQYHDRQPGFIAGVPEPKYFYWSQEAIDWRLVIVAGLLMMLYPAIKAIQFDRIARACGSEASFRDHFAAYIYGDGLDRFLPFNLGMVGTAKALIALGLTRERAVAAVTLSRAFTLFEVAAFALLGLALLGWGQWLSHLFWPIVVLAGAYYLVSWRGRSPAAPRLVVLMWIARTMLSGDRSGRIGFLLAGCSLSLLAFATLDAAVYVLMAAFDTTVLAISVSMPVLMMSLVGGYIAARIAPITPGGIGQWEIGFATTLLLADHDISIPLLCIGLLANVLRIVSGLSLMAIVVRHKPAQVGLRAVCADFKSGTPIEMTLRSSEYPSTALHTQNHPSGP